MTNENGQLLLSRFRQSKNDTFLIMPDSHRLTYGQLCNNALRIADDWVNQGVQPGQTVAFNMANGPALVCCYFAALFGGFVFVPINPELPEEDKKYILATCQASLEIRDEPAIDFNSASVVPCEIKTDDTSVCAIFFTSGTTARPKGVRHSLSSLFGNVLAFNKMMGLGPETRLFHIMPMAYMAGFLNTLLSPLAAGGSVILGQHFTPQTALNFWPVLQREKANTIWLTPSMAVALCRLTRNGEEASNACANLNHIFCGTAPLHDTVRKDFLNKFGKPLQESYGTSELLLISAQNTEDALTYCNVGHVLPEVELNFVTNEEGASELVVKSPFAYQGYLIGGDVLPVEEIDGYVKTGDAGELRDEGLIITGRLKDLIIRGGINISPIAIENVVNELPEVSDVGVIGLSHPFWIENITVCAEAAGKIDFDLLKTKIKDHCGHRLAKFQQPDRIEVFERLPRAITGKIQKGVLQKRLSG